MCRSQRITINDIVQIHANTAMARGWSVYVYVYEAKISFPSHLLMWLWLIIIVIYKLEEVPVVAQDKKYI